MDILSKSDVIKLIKRYQNYILSVDPPENDVPRVLHSIRKLAKLPIKFEELEETGIGKTINALRKRSGTIGEEATLLVAKWKEVVEKQMKEEEEVVEKEKESSKRENCKIDHSAKSKSSVNAGNQEWKRDARKVQNEVTSDQKSDIKQAHLITLKNRNKRKHSEQSDDVEKKKCLKISEKGDRESCSGQKQLISDSADVSPSKTDRESSHSEGTDTDIEKSRKKHGHDDKKHRAHEKRHKSNKHTHKSDRHHRHHSKSSHHEKKRDEENGSSHKRHDKGSKTRSKHEDKKHDKKRESSKKSSSVTDSKRNEKKNRSSEAASIKNNVEASDDFGAALLNIPNTTLPVKKRSTSSKSSTYQDSLHSSSPQKSLTNFDLFSNNMTLEPLDIIDEFKDTEDIYQSPNGNSQTKSISQLAKSEDDMLNSMMLTKNQRTKVFSGNKICGKMKFPTLFDLCIRVLQENFDALEYTGGVPYDLLKPILEKVSVQQLYTFENYNPYLIGETDELWKYHAKKEFRKAERMEYETWRDLYLRCVEEREEKLQSLTENISQSIANSTPARKTKLAYIDTVVKPPRNVARSQAKHGTGSINLQKSPKNLQSSPTAGQSVRDRLVQEAMAPNAIQIPSKANLLVKKKKAPLMQKSLQQFKGLKR